MCDSNCDCYLRTEMRFWYEKIWGIFYENVGEKMQFSKLQWRLKYIDFNFNVLLSWNFNYIATKLSLKSIFNSKFECPESDMKIHRFLAKNLLKPTNKFKKFNRNVWIKSSKYTRSKKLKIFLTIFQCTHFTQYQPTISLRDTRTYFDNNIILIVPSKIHHTS